jgi:16S rRNA processing protein RimM
MGQAADLITVGRVLGAHGIQGWVRVRSFTEPESQLLQYSPLFLKLKSGNVLIDLENSKALTKGWALKLKDTDDRNAAELLRGVEIVMPSDQLPSLNDGEYYWRDLMGMTVIAQGLPKTLLGVVASMIETGANDVLVIEATEHSVDDRERLLPFVFDTYIVAVDLEKREILVDWDPEW